MLTGSRGNQQKGFILVSVLLILTVLISCTVGFAWFARAQFRRISVERFALRSRGMAYAAVLQIAKGLQYDKNDHDSYSEEWFGQHAIPADDMGIMLVNIEPLDGLFPVNELFLPDGVTLRNEIKPSWEKIWKDRNQEGWGTVILDFLDVDEKPRLGSYEKEYFVNRDISDISELLILDDFPVELITGNVGITGLNKILTPWSSGKINLNIAPLEVLILLDGIDESIASEIIETRSLSPFKELKDLTEMKSFSEALMPRVMNMVTFKSTYFRVVVKVLRSDNEAAMLYSAILKKEGSKSPSIVKWEEI